MNAPTISVIVTVYKRTGYLLQALDSVLAQTYRSFEIIVADDSGEGAARRIVDRRSTDHCLTYLQNPQTIGIVPSLKRAADIAKGRYLTILNDDDLWEPTLLEKLVAPLEADPAVVLSFSDHWLIDKDGIVVRGESDVWSRNCGRADLPPGRVNNPGGPALHHSIPTNICAVFRHSAFDGALLDDRVTGAYDYWLACLMASTQRPFFYVAERLARYRLHDQMETLRPAPDKGDNLVFILTQMRARGWFPSFASTLRAELAYALVLAGRCRLANNQPFDARDAFWRSICVRPTFRAVRLFLLTFVPGRWRRRYVAPALVLPCNVGSCEP